jgi:hypothetical protein
LKSNLKTWQERKKWLVENPKKIDEKELDWIGLS